MLHSILCTGALFPAGVPAHDRGPVCPGVSGHGDGVGHQEDAHELLTESGDH